VVLGDVTDDGTLTIADLDPLAVDELVEAFTQVDP
jgi:hypothetical protein